MTRTLVVASGNPKKLAELTRLLDGIDVGLVTLSDLGLPSPVEDGETFEANALLKACAAAAGSGEVAVADDSGLEVDALDGAPGIHSARWSGGGDEDNNDALLDALAGVSEGDRTARFVSAVAVAHPDGRTWVRRGTMQGRILERRRGTNGFGYDPLFQADGFDESNGELAPHVKDANSHRGVALEAIRPVLVGVLSDDVRTSRAPANSPRGTSGDPG